MSVRVLRVSGMPFNTQVWVVDDSPHSLVVYIDKELIKKGGVPVLQKLLRNTLASQQRVDESFVYRTLRAVTG